MGINKLQLIGNDTCTSDLLQLYGGRNCSNKLILSEIVYQTAVEPSILTLSVTNIEGWYATGGGNCTAGGNSTYKGICWNTTGNPTIADSSITYGSRGEGTFLSSMAGLSPSTNYYVKAFAWNASDFIYDAEVAFFTPRLYTACSTFGPHFSSTFSGSDGFLSADTIVTTTGNVSTYVLEWKADSSAGRTVLISGVGSDPSIQVQEPFYNEIGFGGTLWPTIKYIYIDGNKYSAYNTGGTDLYSPDLRNCLPSITVIPIDCCTKLGADPVYPYDLSYINTRDTGANKSRSLKYNICSDDVNYLAWEFAAYTVADQIKLYYCTSTNQTGTLLDNFIFGINYVTTNLYPINYPDGSARTYNQYSQHGAAGTKYITKFDNITYHTGDYIRIDITGSIYEPLNNNTNWELKLKSLYPSDVCCNIPIDSSLSKLTGDVSITYNANSCVYDIFYNTVLDCSDYQWYKGAAGDTFLFNYTDLYYKSPLGNVINTTFRNPVENGLNWKISASVLYMWFGAGTYTCTNCNIGQTINVNWSNDTSMFTFTFTDASDYNAYMSDISSLTHDISYTTWNNLWTTNASDDVRYWAYYQLYWYNASTCGDQYLLRPFYLPLGCDVSYNDSDKTIKFDMSIVPKLVNPVIEVSCNGTHTAIGYIITNINYNLTSAFLSYLPMTTGIRTVNPVASIRAYTYPFYDPYRENIMAFTIDNVMLNGICDLSKLGFMYEPFTPTYNVYFDNTWALFKYWDKVSFTSNASTHDNRMNNWKLERRKFLRTDVSSDTDFELVWEVSLGAKIYP
jgi:hypothetical protein